jgi:iron complex outermembrane receptor protein
VLTTPTADPNNPASYLFKGGWNYWMNQRFGVVYDNRFLPPNPFVTYATFDDPYSGLAFTPKTSLNQRGVSGTADWKITDAVAAKLILAWRKWDGHFATDQDNSPLGFSVVDGNQFFQYTTQELRFSGRLLDRLDWTAGLFNYSGNSRSAQSVELPAFGGVSYYLDPTGVGANGIPNSLLVNGLDFGHFENQSAFLHGIFDITDALHLTLGARYSKDKKHDINDNSISQNVVSIDKTRFDWRAGLDYQINADSMVYASASTGYRPAAFNPRPFQPTQFKGVDGENLIAYELGLKTDLFDRRLRINAAVFYTDYKQRIIPAGGVECLKNPDGSVVPGTLPNPEGGPDCLVNSIPLTAYVNAPAKIKGGELEVAWRPIDPLLITASYGTNQYDASATTFQGRPFQGTTPNGQAGYVPKYNAAAAAQWTANLPNGATLTPRWDAYKQATICSGAGAVSCTDAYVLHNARIEYASQNRDWTLAVGVNNVTNKVYFLNIFDLSVFGEPTVEGQPGKPRAWYLMATHKFGGT